MTASDLDVQELLRTLVAQQTALLNAHTEGTRLQRLLVERLLGSANSSELRAQERTVPITQAHVASEPTASTASTDRPPPTAAEAPDSHESEFVVAAASEPAQSTDPKPAAATPPDAPATERSPIRGSRYYQSQNRSDRSLARPTTLHDLDVLRSIQASGDVGNLILTFGPHAGETLGQVARSDPEYLRRLALSAQRPDVRAAAARLVNGLPLTPSAHYGRRQTKSRRK